MKFSLVYARAALGVQAPLVTVETHLLNGLPRIKIVGLAETAVKESQDRVRSAIVNSHFKYPNQRIVINLAPADLPKEGGRYDLAIALGILLASRQVSAELANDYEFCGELALNGDLRFFPGSIPCAVACEKAARTLVLPAENKDEIAAAQVPCLPANSLLDVCAHLNQKHTLAVTVATKHTSNRCFNNDMSEVKGQAHAKRALEIAAAGKHNVLFSGPPGTGKTLLASRLPSLLPVLSNEEALESAMIRSIAKQPLSMSDWRQPPFRAPHHTASAVALVGGGSHPKPGEISLAHGGVLFLDELPEFNRHVLEVLREPLESGKILISRAETQTEFPANFQLIAAMNPCPCGYFGSNDEQCHCPPASVARYQLKISGPLLDRIDLQLSLKPVPLYTIISNNTCEESSASIRERILAARQKQLSRQGKINNLLNSHELQEYASLDKRCQQQLLQAVDKFKLSARAYHRIIRVSRTIADLANKTAISADHINEAISYRTKNN